MCGIGQPAPERQRQFSGISRPHHHARAPAIRGDAECLADEVRARKHPGNVVTYIIDRNVNYTNVCVARCNFCAFYREVGHREGYVLGFDEIFQRMWLFYLCYSRAGFETGYLDVQQIVLDSRRAGEPGGW